MKVFVSSLIAGMEPIRAAAREAIGTLRYSPIMAEDFPAQPNSPQVACLTGLREADLVLLVLGERYGAEQDSGLSATHEEYREAKTSKPVIAFVQEGVTFEPSERAFVDEVQGWAGGLLRGGFREPGELQRLIVRALHDHALANAVGPVNEAELVERARGLMPSQQRSSYSGPVLHLAVAGGPTQEILRPIQLEDEALWDMLHQTALFGTTRVFDKAEGATNTIEGPVLVITQGRDGARVQLDQQGGIAIRLPIDRSGQTRGAGHAGLAVVIQEKVQRQLAAALAYAAWVLEHIDPTRKLSHVAVAARISGGEFLAWRTQAEHEASPSMVTMGHAGAERPIVHLTKPRAALHLDQSRLVEDLLVPIRRHWQR